jgi:hypothetical protein
MGCPRFCDARRVARACTFLLTTDTDHIGSKGAIRACLDQNQASLSAECAARAERAAAREKEKS